MAPGSTGSSRTRIRPRTSARGHLLRLGPRLVRGAIGGALGVFLWAWWRGLGTALLDLAAPAFALGYAVGRVGCQLGDGNTGRSGRPLGDVYRTGRCQRPRRSTRRRSTRPWRWAESQRVWRLRTPHGRAPVRPYLVLAGSSACSSSRPPQRGRRAGAHPAQLISVVMILAGASGSRAACAGRPVPPPPEAAALRPGRRPASCDCNGRRRGEPRCRSGRPPLGADEGDEVAVFVGRSEPAAGNLCLVVPPPPRATRNRGEPFRREHAGGQVLTVSRRPRPRSRAS